MTQGNKHNPIGEESRLFGCRALLLHDWVKTQEVQNRSKGTLEHKCSMIWNPNSEHPSHWTCTCKYPGRLSTQTSFAKLQHKPSEGAFHTPNLNNHKKKKIKNIWLFFPQYSFLGYRSAASAVVCWCKAGDWSHDARAGLKHLWLIQKFLAWCASMES